MFNMDEWSKKQYEKIFNRFGLDTDPLYPKWFKKFMKFIAFKFVPFLFMISSFIILYWFLNTIQSNHGLEKMLVLVSVIIIFTLRGLNKHLEKLIEENKKGNKPFQSEVVGY